MEKTINKKDETFNEKIHEKVNKWVEKLDDLQLQISLGKMEAKDEFEKGKKQLHNLIQDYTQSFNHFKKVASEKAGTVEHAFNELKKEFKKDEEITEKSIKKHKDAIVDIIKEVNDKLQ